MLGLIFHPTFSGSQGCCTNWMPSCCLARLNYEVILCIHFLSCLPIFLFSKEKFLHSSNQLQEQSKQFSRNGDKGQRNVGNWFAQALALSLPCTFRWPQWVVQCARYVGTTKQ